MLKSLIIALSLGLFLTTPALAISGLTDVPSTWPAEGAFENSTVSQLLSEQDIDAPTPTPPTPDR